jgi:hypothetical protein
MAHVNLFFGFFDLIPVAALSLPGWWRSNAAPLLGSSVAGEQDLSEGWAGFEDDPM